MGAFFLIIILKDTSRSFFIFLSYIIYQVYFCTFCSRLDSFFDMEVMMKIKLILLLVLTGVLLGLCIVFIKPDTGGTSKEETTRAVDADDYKTFTYVITKVDGNEYQGQSIDGKTKIQFNSENIKYPLTEKLEVKDKIVAYVESENHINGIVKIEKIENEK
jgi:hypothetical protein